MNPVANENLGRWLKLGICFAFGLILWFIPEPENVDPRGWKVLAVFSATILSFILRPVPMAVTVLLALLILTLTTALVEPGSAKPSKTSYELALSGYGKSVVWLVFSAFLISGAVLQTGLGRRIALFLIHALGKSPRGLAYGIGAAELVLGPVVPSNTARGGGILAPIVGSLCKTLDGDKLKTSPMSEFLVLFGAQANLITAAMFLTGMAANPLVAAAAETQGLEFGWLTWAKGAIVPGLAALFLLPWLLVFFLKPDGARVAAARESAGVELRELGVITRGEKVLVGVFVLMLTLWITGGLKWHGIHSSVVALIGVMTLLLTGVQTWKDMAKNHGAWDALVWLGGLVCLAGLLAKFGFNGGGEVPDGETVSVIKWFADNAKGWVTGMSGVGVAIVLALIYFYSMYGFSMLTGHITAMVAAFLAVGISAGAPPMLMVALLAYFSNLCGCLTNYSTGPIVIYFGLNYVTAPKWLKIGFLVSLFHLAIWLGLGLLWWKLLGWW